MSMFTTPFSSRVNKQIMWYKSTKKTIKYADKINDGINIKNLVSVIDKSKWNGYGSNIAIISTGKHLKQRLEILSPNILDVHIE